MDPNTNTNTGGMPPQNTSAPAYPTNPQGNPNVQTAPPGYAPPGYYQQPGAPMQQPGAPMQQPGAPMQQPYYYQPMPGQPAPPPPQPPQPQTIIVPSTVAPQPEHTTVIVNNERKEEPNHILHCIITMFFFPWIIVWIAVCISHAAD